MFFSYGDHGSTFGGNPLSCAAGCVIMNQLTDEMMKETGEKGKYLFDKLVMLKSEFPDMIRDVRGKGLMVGIELAAECTPLVQYLIDIGILVNCSNKKVIRLLPPFIITYPEIDFFIDGLRSYPGLRK